MRLLPLQDLVLLVRHLRVKYRGTVLCYGTDHRFINLDQLRLSKSEGSQVNQNPETLPELLSEGLNMGVDPWTAGNCEAQQFCGGLSATGLYRLSAHYVKLLRSGFRRTFVRKLGPAVRRPTYVHLVAREIYKTGKFPYSVRY